MDNLVKKFKKQRLRLEVSLPVDPSMISGLGVILSFGVFYHPIVTLTVVLLMDLLDGMVARARNMSSRAGELSDWACDRASEFIIFGYYALENPLVLLLPTANTLIACLLARGRKVIILPLRQLLLIYLLWSLFF